MLYNTSNSYIMLYGHRIKYLKYISNIPPQLFRYLLFYISCKITNKSCSRVAIIMLEIRNYLALTNVASECENRTAY